MTVAGGGVCLEETPTRTSLRKELSAAAVAAARHVAVQVLLAVALILPLMATVGQFGNSGFFRQTVGFEILFWPGGKWHWVIPMNVAAMVGLLGSSYIAAIVRLFRSRTLAIVIFAGIGGLIAANLVGGAVNHFTGWRELQVVGSMDLAGKANQIILSLWHNPIWEEVVFRGIPLLGLAILVKRWPGARRAGTWCYFLVPSLVMAAYHVPGHGYARLADSFVLSLVFASIALRYGFCAVMVLHYIFDALMVLSLGKLKNIPTGEVQWLADRAGLLNSLFFLANVTVLLLLLIVFLRHCRRARKSREVVSHPQR